MMEGYGINAQEEVCKVFSNKHPDLNRFLELKHAEYYRKLTNMET